MDKGGFCYTYRAKDTRLGIDVAVKEYFPHGVASREDGSTVAVYTEIDAAGFEKGKKRFLKEARGLAQFNKNPGIVSVSDYFEENDTAYIVMELLEGMNLKKYMLDNNGAVALDFIYRITEKICDVLTEIHSKGIIHRDISPDNIFLCNDGIIKLIDFGALNQDFGDADSNATIIIKQGYAPPEQYYEDGEQGAWTDIYALGATLYHLTTGKLPQQSVSRLQNDKLVPPHEINVKLPRTFSVAVMKAMSLNVRDRYSSADDFKKDLLNGMNTLESSVPLGDYYEDDEDEKTEMFVDNYSKTNSQAKSRDAYPETELLGGNDDAYPETELLGGNNDAYPETELLGGSNDAYPETELLISGNKTTNTGATNNSTVNSSAAGRTTATGESNSSYSNSYASSKIASGTGSDFGSNYENKPKKDYKKYTYEETKVEHRYDKPAKQSFDIKNLRKYIKPVIITIVIIAIIYLLTRKPIDKTDQEAVTTTQATTEMTTEATTEVSENDFVGAFNLINNFFAPTYIPFGASYREVKDELSVTADKVEDLEKWEFADVDDIYVLGATYGEVFYEFYFEDSILIGVELVWVEGADMNNIVEKAKERYGAFYNTWTFNDSDDIYQCEWKEGAVNNCVKDDYGAKYLVIHYIDEETDMVVQMYLSDRYLGKYLSGIQAEE